jgi:hypothetical protein
MFSQEDLWLSPDTLNSDGHQFNQYQQHKQSPFIFTELTEQEKGDYDI